MAEYCDETTDLCSLDYTHAPKYDKTKCSSQLIREQELNKKLYRHWRSVLLLQDFFDEIDQSQQN
jgi:hypothetical protein